MAAIHRAESALSIGANSTSTNRLSGTLTAFSIAGMLARLMAVGSAAGLTVLFQINQTTLINNEAVSTANRFPQEKDDVICRARMGANGRPMNLQFANSTGGALTVNYILDFI